MRPAFTRALVLSALLLLVPAAVAPAAARRGTATEQRAIRATMAKECMTATRNVQIAVSRRDARFAIFAFDDRRRATTLCTAIVRRSTKRARSWRIVEFRQGLATTDRAITKCPKALPRDLRGTVQPSGARDPQVYCGN